MTMGGSPALGPLAGNPSVMPPITANPMGGAAAPTGQAGAGAGQTTAGTMAPSNAGAGGAVAVPSGPVSYHKDIRPIMEARCYGCHVAGGAGGFELNAWDKVQPLAAAVVAAVTSRKMPPWLADSENCMKTRYDQRLTAAQLGLFTAWKDAGFPEGNAADFVAIVEEKVRDVGPPTLTSKSEDGPVSLRAGTEWYECVPNVRVSQDTWVTAIEIVPDRSEFVHHAIVNVGRSRDYCTALGIGAENVYSFRPGSQRLVFEEGDAMLIPAGSWINVQYHYNTRFAKGTNTDHSTVNIWSLPAGQKPMRAIARMPNHDMLINIPVGAVNQREGESASLSVPAGGEVIGISPHMHYLGQSFKETLRKRDGTEVCLVDIPDWDQDWQLDYFFNPSDYIPATSGMVVDQTCMFSNRLEDQGKDPEGKPFTPMYTTYGEDTRQEMCLGYIWYRYPL
jgi:hypothetical protein